MEAPNFIFFHLHHMEDPKGFRTYIPPERLLRRSGAAWVSFAARCLPFLFKHQFLSLFFFLSLRSDTVFSLPR